MMTHGQIIETMAPFCSALIKLRRGPDPPQDRATALLFDKAPIVSAELPIRASGSRALCASGGGAMFRHPQADGMYHLVDAIRIAMRGD
jgi:hypothetical protein